MFVYEIKKESQLRQPSSKEKPSTNSPITRAEQRKEVFARHLARCLFDVGDVVSFRKPRKPKVTGVIEAIEEDMSKVLWTDSGTPLYIKVRLEPHPKRKVGEEVLWTVESRISYKGPSKNAISTPS